MYLTFYIYSVVTFCKTLILCPFSAKIFIKNYISLSKYFLEQMFSPRDKNHLNTPIVMSREILERGSISTFTVKSRE